MSLRRVGGKDDGGVDILGWWWLPITSHAHGHGHASSIAPAAPVSTSGGMADGLLSKRDYRTRIRVVAQCKDEKKKVGPKYVRELEGVLYRYLAGTGTFHTRSTQCTAKEAGNVEAQLQSPEVLDGENGQSLLMDTADPVVGLLISSAPFTKATLLRMHSSPVPLALLHIPPIPPINITLKIPTPPVLHTNELDDVGRTGATKLDECALGSLVFNPALGSASGLLRGQVQPRWEHPLTSPLASGTGGRPALWCAGRRVHSWTPERD